jgi:glycine cleavage system H protein
VSELRRTPLFDLHRSLGARMVPFGGFEMPVQYEGIKAEHGAVRERAGLFDVSHMGQIHLQGPEAVASAERLVTCPVASLRPGRVRYGVLCNESGGSVDDVTVYRMAEDRLFLCVNASNIDKDRAWIEGHALPGVVVDDRSETTGLIALQGPRSPEVLASLAEADVARLKFFRFVETPVAGCPALISRSGYTGSDGYEIYLEADRTADLFQALRRYCAGGPGRSRHPAPGSRPAPLRPRARRRNHTAGGGAPTLRQAGRRRLPGRRGAGPASRERRGQAAGRLRAQRARRSPRRPPSAGRERQPRWTRDLRSALAHPRNLHRTRLRSARPGGGGSRAGRRDPRPARVRPRRNDALLPTPPELDHRPKGRPVADTEIPGDLRYSREDEWARLEDGRVFIGVTDYAQQQLGDVVFVELPEVGTAFDQGAPFGIIESVKAVSDLYAPISGTVTEVNDELVERPELVNESCYQNGWMLALEPSDPAQLDALLEADAYAQHVEDRKD